MTKNTASRWDAVFSQRVKKSVTKPKAVIPRSKATWESASEKILNFVEIQQKS